THSLVGVASSTSLETAQAFIAKVKAPPPCVPHGSYESLLASPGVDIVYIATPHSHHFQNAMAALHLGKHVLCEKPLAVSGAQAKKLFAVAEAKKRFLMEGLWTRFLPAGLAVHQLIRGGAVGTITRVFADNSLGMDPTQDFITGDRMLAPWLAGGALMDLAVYSLHWVFQAMSPRAKPRYPIKISSAATLNSNSGVDETVTILMILPPAAEATEDPAILAIASASLRATDDPDGHTPVVRIQGDKGEIQVFGPPWRPSRVCVVECEQGPKKVSKTHEVDVSFPNRVYGLRYEADEAAMCIYYFMKESMTVPWEDTLLRMRVLDSVRRQNRIVFPAEVESVDYPVALPTKTRK
ncbi:NAD(P)-binding protein, partial [Aspergillus campestris IBT 28561]